MPDIAHNCQIPVANLEQQLDKENHLTDIEKHKLLVEWNNTTRDYPQDKCIHELFEATVERIPLSVAVAFKEERLTYRELNARANQLAHYLKTLGVGPEVLVGICVERSLEMVVGVLGILKAGGAYVPLDPAYPSERLTFMLEDTQTSVLLTQARLVESLPPHSSRVVCLDSDWEEIARHSQSNPFSQVATTNLAYVIYTSGSTGRPKGVAMSHRPLCNLLFWQLESSTVSTGAKTLQFAPLSFDVSFQEIFSTWCSDGTLVLISEELRRDAIALLHFLSEKAIERLFLPFVALQLLAEVADGEQVVPTSLREIVTAGEQLKITRQIANWFTKLKSCTLHNHYGPSESHVVTAFTLTGSPLNWPALPPVGRPIANTQIYLLSAQLQLVPVGVPGELYIGGIALARGYLNRPDLTDERFIPNPFSDKPGERLYKTGDLACYLPDGNIEFLGRSDHQVKIRGFRIELGEIEAALWQHPAVREAAVMAREDAPSDKRLVAYVVHNPQDQSLQEQATDSQVEQVSITQKVIPHLRSFLQEKLPDYMVPSVFMMLDALPLTPNGKVDRRALPVPELRPELELTFVAPRTPIEEMLASIWAGVLGIEQLGIHNNFFELGGHSLLATQVISKVRDTLAVELPLRSLFEAPTVAELAEHVENLLYSEQSVQAEPLLAIPRSGNIPLSFAQARLWFLDQLQPNSAFYNIPLALRFSGQLNVAAIEQSLNEIIRRHEALRTNFATVEGQPVQVIASTLDLKLFLVDLLYLPFCDREIEAQRLVTTVAEQPFDLEREPLVRAKLLRLDETEYVLLLTMHHIISDGWSVGVLYAELAALYEAFCTGKPRVLPELPIQYADFAVWQRHWLAGEVKETQLNYWKQQLKDAPTLLELPTDRPRPAIQTFRGAHQSVALPLELSQALAELSKRTGVTLFMTLYAAFVTLLYRYTGESDIVVGTPVANRTRQEIEGLIGFFVNTLALRTDLSSNPSFEQLLHRVREVALGAYAHQDLPFEQLVETLQPERSLSHTPLFQVMFALQNAPMPSIKLPDLTVSSFSVEMRTVKFDLTLSMENTVSGLIGEWEYNSDLFDAATIARMAGHFQTLLEGIVANPQQRVSEVPLLTQRERHQLLFEWNNTTKKYPQDKCIHQLFEEQVERTPEAVAVLFEGEQLTYRELNAKANQLAHYLKTLGVGPEVLVGICVERSLEMVVGLLGILKAGGAYVPLDPAYPSERLTFMLEDSAVPVLLTQQRLVDKLPQHKAQVVCLDTQWKAIAQNTEEKPVCGVNADNLAYVIYTSGSTGKPKGVTIQHRSLVNYTTAVSIEYGLEKRESVASKERLRSLVEEHSAERVLQFASISFDASAEEIYPCLTSGATLVLRTDSMLDSVDIFLQKCRAWNLTVLSLPTAYWHELTARLSQETLVLPPSLRLVIIGGEKALPEPLKTWIECVGEQVHLVNTYGPTEATVVATICELSAAHLASRELPIGRPISNVQTYVLDQCQRPLPIGVPGELYIGGDGLARGYLNRPDLIAERFTRNPFSNAPSSCLYKTGDLVRYLSDGNIEYLGRIDNQVKIRGFRIELGEVEAAIAQHPTVRETVVVAREDTPGNKRLVAYVVPKREAVQETVLPTINELRSFLKTKLPDYMVPGAFMFLDAMPLTPNRKIDRRALPVPDSSWRELENKFVAPSTPTEELLAAIWAKVLGLQQVGINDNFFELGGHSLLATQIISRIREAFSIELPLRHLFESPTIASLSKVIETVRSAESQEQSAISRTSNTLPPLAHQREDALIPLSLAQEYIWYVQQLNPDSSICNSGVDLRFIGVFSPEVLEKSINEIIRRHEILRTTFTVVEGQPVQVIANELTLPLKIVDLQDLPLAEREALAQRLAAEEADYHFDLEDGPLMKTTLLRLAPKEYWLLIPMHHIITDGWSIGIFVQELQTLYNAFSNGLPSELPELPLQYADFALWQRKQFNEEVLAHQLTYWLQKLADTPQPQAILPAEQPKSNLNIRRASSYSLVLRENLVASIKALSRSQGVTISSIIIAALKLLLFKWSRQSDILIVATIGNRSMPEAENLLGCFINDVILRSKLDDEQTGLVLLEEVKETLSEAIENKEVPLQKIIEALGRVRDFTPSASVTVVPPVENWKSPILEVEELFTSSSKDQLWHEAIPLELYVCLPNEDSQTIEIALFYSTELFTDETIERQFSYYQEILQKLVEYPETKLSEF